MADDQTPVAKQEVNLQEIGTTGLKRTNGIITEEFLTDLRGKSGMKIYREMSDNDPIIGGALLAIKHMARQASWDVKPGGDRLKDEKAAEFIEENIEDMNMSWSRFITEALSMLSFGWSMFEVVYKRRDGDPFSIRDGSQFDDGRIGWQKFAVRPQDTLDRWIIADNGDIEGVVQKPEHDFRERTIPIEKAVLFRTTHERNNPEGKSALRNAYRPWTFKKTIEEVEAIGLERDLAGIPRMDVPPRLLKENATDEEKATLSHVRDMLEDVRQDKAAGLIVPAMFDADGNRIFDFSLEGTKGRRTHDTNEIINRKNKEMAASFLADFILIGHQAVGSFALASSKTHMFSVAIGAYLDEIQDQLNRRAIPTLLRLNGMTTVAPPRITHSDVETLDLDQLAAFITSLTRDANLDLTGEEIQSYLKEQAGMPEDTPAETMPDDSGDNGGDNSE